MRDDIAAVRSVVEKLVDADREVVMVLHSAGGFLGSNAIDSLGAKSRAERGLKGGVIKLVFLAGAIFPEGFKHSPLPFLTYDVCPPHSFLHLLFRGGENSRNKTKKFAHFRRAEP